MTLQEMCLLGLKRRVIPRVLPEDLVPYIAGSARLRFDSNALVIGPVGVDLVQQPDRLADRGGAAVRRTDPH
jgi:hypothetical protein